MKLYRESKGYKLYHGNMLDMASVIEPNSIDSIVTDPPYELNFMGKGWDNAGVSFNKDTWKRCFDVLKPGGYLLAFGGSRTFHRIACAIEDAGFEIRDTIMWIYGSGFPKSMNIGLAVDKKNGVESPVVGVSNRGAGASPQKLDNHTKGDTGIGMLDGSGKTFEIKEPQNEWKGWGTCLKPAFEPIIIARKPFSGSLVDNVLEYGVGGLNIDECRVGEGAKKWSKPKGGIWNPSVDNGAVLEDNPLGRFPANVVLTYDESDYNEVCGGFPSTGSGNNGKPYNYAGKEYHNKDTSMFNGDKPKAPSNYNDNGSASRYFYCAKASKKDRNEGLDAFEDKFKPATEYRPFLMREAEQGKTEHNAFLRLGKVKNNHPTVKPTELMQYLVRLVTPNGGTVLDPFNGSGSTGKAVMYENVERDKGYTYIGIELTEDYLPISKARIDYASNQVREKCEEPIKKTVEKCESNELTQVGLW